MIARPPVLWVDRAEPATVAAALDWCRANPGGWVFPGVNVVLGAEASIRGVSSSRAERLAWTWSLRAACWRASVPVQILVGMRPDVFTPGAMRNTVGASLAARGGAFVARSAVSRDAALAEWVAAGYTVDQQVSESWYAPLTDATLYVSLVASQRIAVVGVVADMGAPGYAAWLAAEARAWAQVLQPDGWLVGCKPWLRAGSDYAHPSDSEPLRGTNLIQPPPYDPPSRWARGLGDCLLALGQSAPVVTTTRPIEPGIDVLLADDWRAREEVMGEAQIILGVV